MKACPVTCRFPRTQQGPLTYESLSSYLPVPSCMNIMVFRLSPQAQRVMQRKGHARGACVPVQPFTLRGQRAGTRDPAAVLL